MNYVKDRKFNAVLQPVLKGYRCVGRPAGDWLVRSGAGRGRLGWPGPGSGWLSGLLSDTEASTRWPDASLPVPVKRH